MRIMNKSPLCHLAGLAVLLLCLSNPAKAALLVYEGFNYGSNISNIVVLSAGQGGGGGDSFGWASPWNGNNVSGSTNSVTGLSYTDQAGHTLLTDPGSLVVGCPVGAPGNSQPGRAMAIGTTTGTQYSGMSNATYWVSFLIQWIGPPTAGSNTNLYVRKGDLTFRTGTTYSTAVSGNSGTATLTVGSPNALNRLGTTYDTWTTWTGGDATAGTQNTGLQAATNLVSTFTFVLMRLDVDGNMATPDTTYVWLNWTNLTATPTISQASLTNTTANLTGLNDIRLDANGGNASGTNTVLAFDEFRVGTAFADVVPRASVPQPPTITAQPANTSATVGDPAGFTADANGDAPIRYQWYFNTNTALTGETNATFTIPSVQTNDAGGYSVVVSNNNGAVTSLVATLTVLQPVPPYITSQPQNWTNVAGFVATFTVGAGGSAPLHYQWYFNTYSNMTGRTNATLSFTIASTDNAGNYSVVVTNKFGSVTSSVAELTVIPHSPAFLPAFPGADGAAKCATGGRYGIVYHVTVLDKNFNDVRRGTLRYGLNNANFPVGVPRTIVFDVAGVFWLGLYGAESNYDNGWNAGQSRYDFPGNATIAGESAPGPVIIMGGNVHCNYDNTIVRNITFAPGYGMQGFHVPPTPPTVGDFPDSYVYDAVDVQSVSVMLDHLTTIYATDEAISCNEMADNLTIENCNVSQGQNYPQADAEATNLTYTGHALAHLLQAGSNAKISVLNNLYAHQKGRLPRVGTEANKLTVPGVGAYNDFRNNVFYNWLSTAGSGASGQPSFDNFINNFYLVGPGGDNPYGGTNYAIVTNAGGTGIFNGADSTLTRVYRTGNIKDTNKDGVPQFATSADGDYTTIAAQTTAYDVDIGLTLSVQDAFTNVLRYVGSRWWTRPYVFTLGNAGDISTNDIAASIDERLIHETITGTGKIMAWADDPFNDDPNEGVEWRELLALRANPVTGAAPFNRPAGWDTDGDGMPDNWEIEHGLNPNVPDNNGDFDNSGYSNLEKYLIEIAAWPAPGDILFTGARNNRYAEIFNWQVNGVVVNVNGTNVTTSSMWKPSRYDTAVISNATVVVDAVGQCTGTLRLTNNGVLNITMGLNLNTTNGWLQAGSLVIGPGCTLAVQPAGTLRLTGSGSISLSAGGTFTNAGKLDIMTWTGTLPAGFVNTGTVLDRSLIRFDSAVRDGANIRITIKGYLGHNYQLQYRDNPPGGTWTNVGEPVAGANAPIIFTQANNTSVEVRFYRVVVD
jgi:hypothetical protein